MQKIVLQKVEEVLNNGKADRILAWGKGEFSYDPTPAVFTKDTGFDNFVYSDFCSSNLSKYLIKESKKDGKIAVLLKPCDTYG
ncbi:MAG: 4Fe-4S ferredoxin, partial [Oscillospiraceae bacterium]